MLDVNERPFPAVTYMTLATSLRKAAQSAIKKLGGEVTDLVVEAPLYD